MRGKKLTALILTVVILSLSLGCFSFATEISNGPSEDGLTLYAPSSVLLNMDTGEVLYEHNANDRKYPASTTKIMTALLAIENLDLDATSTVSYNAVMSISYDSSRLGLYENEVHKNKDLIYAMMVASGNDAANVLAESVAGSVSDFVDMMNKRAKDIGCKDTHFVNTHGLTDENHYTTASDMAKITYEAMKNPIFRDVVKTTYYELPTTSQCSTQRIFYTTNNMISNVRTSNYLYSPATGVKTGYTDAALNCLVASAEKDGVRLISVVLSASNIDGVNTAYTDTKQLFDWGFNNYKSFSVVKEKGIVDERAIKYAKGGKTIKIAAKEPYNWVLKNDADLSLFETKVNITRNLTAPIFVDEVLGTMEVFYDGELLGTVEVCPDKDYEYSWWAVFKTTLFRIIGVFLIIIFVLFILLLILRQYRYEQRRKQRIRNKNRI